MHLFTLIIPLLTRCVVVKSQWLERVIMGGVKETTTNISDAITWCSTNDTSESGKTKITGVEGFVFTTKSMMQNINSASLQSIVSPVVHPSVQSTDSPVIRTSLQVADSLFVHTNLKSTNSPIHTSLQSTDSAVVHTSLQTADSPVVHTSLKSTDSSVHTGLQSTDSPVFYTSLQINDSSIVHVLTDDIINCFNTNQDLFLFAEQGTVSLNASNAGHTPLLPSVCFIHVTVPVGKIILIDSDDNKSQYFSGIFTISDGDDKTAKWLVRINYEEFELKEPLMIKSVYSTSNSVLFHLFIIAIEEHLDIRLRFQAVDGRPRQPLELKFTNDKQGYVQSPGFGSRWPYPPYLDEWVEIQLLPREAIMISVDYLSLSRSTQDLISVYGEYNSENRLIWNIFNERPESIVITNIYKLRFHFKTDYFRRESKGFRILFSIHDENMVPEKLPSGLWNCSVPYFSSFQLHLPCNLEKECENGEDEKRCPYTSDLCDGMIAYDKTCYSYNLVENRLSWLGAKEFCENHGGQLANLVTISKWHTVHYALSYGLTLSYVYTGLILGSFPFEYYRGFFQWSNGHIAYYVQLKERFAGQTTKPIAIACTALFIHLEMNYPYFNLVGCVDMPIGNVILCEHDVITGQVENEESSTVPIKIKSTFLWSNRVTYVECPKGHVTHDFLSCDMQSVCFLDMYTQTCESPIAHVSPFVCDNQVEMIPYQLVCDFRKDCSDGSDEEFCIFKECGESEKRCTNGQCVLLHLFCNKVHNCIDGSDELDCLMDSFLLFYGEWLSISPPLIMLHDDKGTLIPKYLINPDACPETHFMCLSEVICLPVYVRCNGISDCPGQEDETKCDTYTCPGYYRCRASTICLHASHVCDDVFQCPQRDDELLCQMTCPQNCTCIGTSYSCTGHFQVIDYPQLRYLDVTRTQDGMTYCNFLNITNNPLLIYLGLKKCGLTMTTLNTIFLPASLYNLKILDLSDNNLIFFSNVFNILSSAKNLRVLKLSGNPLVLDLTVSSLTRRTSPSLYVLDLSRVTIPEINDSVVNVMSELRELNLSHTGLSVIKPAFLNTLTKLEVIDLRGDPLSSVPLEELRLMRSLRLLWSDDFKFCCSNVIPNSLNSENCFAPFSEVSSCEHLLKSSLHRVVLWVLTTLSLLGNGVNVVLQVFIEKDYQSAHSILIFTLFLSYFLNGFVLAIIGVADLIFQGHYVMNDNQWMQSTICKMSGFLSLFASELSAFCIVFIIIFRITELLISPSRIQLLIYRKLSLILSCSVTCLLAFGFSLMTLMPTSHRKFEGQTGICIPIPFIMDKKDDFSYTMIIIVCLNLILFLLVAIGQVAIYKLSNDTRLTITKCHASYQVTNMVMLSVGSYIMTSCLFYLMCTSALSSNDVTLGMTLFLIPLNAAVNPFLFRLNKYRQNQRQAQEKRLLILLERQLNGPAITRA